MCRGRDLNTSPKQASSQHHVQQTQLCFQYLYNSAKLSWLCKYLNIKKAFNVGINKVFCPSVCRSVTHSPSSSVFSLVQLVLSFTFLKCGCFSLSPVSNTATFTPEPLCTHAENTISSDKPMEAKASHKVASKWTWNRPVWPICQRTSAWRIWATWRGMARSRRLLEWRPVACQNPEPSDKLVRRNGRDDCHDCHFCVPWVVLQGAEGSGAAETRETGM